LPWFVLFCIPAVLTTPPERQLSGGKGGYNISCSDIRYFQLTISVNTLPRWSYILAPQILGLA
jgi:hypothetical protein